MAKCMNCGRLVDSAAVSCPGCGRNEPGKDEAVLVAAGLGIVLFCALFLLPSLLVIYPFSDGIQNTIQLALQSIWAWLGSAIFWAVLGGIIYGAYESSKQSVQQQGRQFTCFNCEQLMAEARYGDLDRGGVRCSCCESVNHSPT